MTEEEVRKLTKFTVSEDKEDIRGDFTLSIIMHLMDGAEHTISKDRIIDMFMYKFKEPAD